MKKITKLCSVLLLMLGLLISGCSKEKVKIDNNIDYYYNIAEQKLMDFLPFYEHLGVKEIEVIAYSVSCESPDGVHLPYAIEYNFILKTDDDFRVQRVLLLIDENGEVVCEVG